MITEEQAKGFFINRIQKAGLRALPESDLVRIQALNGRIIGSVHLPRFIPEDSAEAENLLESILVEALNAAGKDPGLRVNLRR